MKKSLLAFLFLVLPFVITAQSPNDNCSDATILQINTGLEPILKTSGTIAAATASPETDYCSAQNHNDVWFKFTATSTIHRISLLDITGSTTNLNHTVYKGNDCSTMIQLYCSDPNNSSASGLVIGEIYKIRIYCGITSGVQNSSFNIAVTTPSTGPANDDCANAISLTVNPSGTCTPTVSSTLYNATNSGITDPCYSAEDIWFKFVATGTQHKITISNISGSINEIKYSVYLNNCSGEDMISCNLSVNDIIQGLTVGQTYMIKAQSWQGAAAAQSAFTICLSDITPVNDHCSSAITLTPGSIPNCTSPISGDLINTSPSTVMSGCGIFSRDLWYEFTATNTTHYLWLTKTSGTGSVQYDLFKGDNCAVLTFIKCGSNIPEYNSFIPGQLYKIRVYTDSYVNDNLTFTICLGTKASVPVNDNCSGAIIIPVGTTSQCTQAVAGTIAGATASSESLNCGGSADDDVWFEFVATSSKHTITITNISDTAIELYSILYSEYNCGFPYSKNCYNTSAKYTANCEIGQTYKIRIYSYTATPNQITTFNICVTTPPPPPVNDNCDNAITLTISPTMTCEAQITGTTESATASTVAAACGGGGSQDVWYQFTATSTRHMVNCTTTAGANLPTALYTNNCVTPIAIGCSANMFENLTPGQIYKVRLTTTTTVNFTICITTPPAPPANDACANAPILPVNTGTDATLSTIGIISWATSSPEGVSCITSNQRQEDVWYQFTATNNIHRILIKFANPNIEGTPNLAIGLYKGTNCSTMSLIQCSSGYMTDGVYDNFIPGETYKIRIFKINAQSIFTDFAISILTMPAPPTNDICNNATVLPVTPGQTCIQPIHGSLTSATYTSIPVNGTSKDVWYQFTATHTTHNLNLTNIININPQILKIQLFDGTCGSLVFKNTFVLANTPVITDLIPGNIYKVRLFIELTTSAGAINSFDLCLTEPYPAPINDECITALTIPVNAGLVCNESVAGTVLGSTKSTNNITSPISTKIGDVWYSFTATATKHLIKITSSDITLSHAVYSGTSCNTLTLLYYQDMPGITSSIANNLTIGQVYTIRILCNIRPSNESKDFSVCILTPLLATNDECANAIELTVNSGSDTTEYSEGSLQQATKSVEPAGCTYYNDLWYKFTATATRHNIYFKILGIVTPSNIEIFDASTCSAITCNSLITTYNNYANNLVIGRTYFIKYRSNSVTTGDPYLFRIAVNTPTAPINDECANAAIAPVNQDPNCVAKYTGELILATTSTQGANCISTQRDIWVEFTATSNYHTITNLSNTSGIKTGYTIYQGGSCNLNTLYCGEFTYTATYAFVAGEKYTIRVYAKNAENYSSLPVELCITTPVTCNNPEPFVSGYDKYVFSGVNSIPVINDVSCIGTTTRATWFAIKITNPGDIEYQISLNQKFDPYGTPLGLNMSNFKYAVWGPFENMTQGCENLSPSNILRCNSVTNGNPGSFLLSGVQTGQYYIVLVGNETSSFTGNAFIKFEQTGGTSATGPLQPPSGNTNQAFSQGQTLADIEVNNPNNGNIIWYDTPGQSLTGILSDNDTNNEPSIDTPIPLSTPLVDGATYYAAYAIYGVESTRRLAVTVGSAPETPAPTGETQQLFTTGETLADLEINGQNIKWYNNENATTPLPDNTLLTDGSSYAASQSINGLESINRLTVTVIYYEAPAPTGPVEQTFTDGQTLANLEINGENIKWYTTANDTNALAENTSLADNTTYYATQTLNSIESISRLAITVHLIITETPAPTGPAEQTFTEGATLADVEIDGENILWYINDVTVPAPPTEPGATLPLTTILEDSKTYYASQTINGVESKERLAVTTHLILGRNDAAFGKLQYYPNPVKAILTITNSTIENISVTNIIGQQVLTKSINAERADVDMGSLPAGIYIVKIETDGKTKSIKIIKK